MITAIRVATTIAAAGVGVSCSPAVVAEGGRYGILEWVVVLSILFMSVALSLSLVRGPASTAPAGGSYPGQIAFLSCTIALFGILMAGLFVFMTFRIDREAQYAARATAEQIAGETAEGVADRAADSFFAQNEKQFRQIAAEIAAGSLLLEPDGAQQLRLGSRLVLELDNTDSTEQWVTFTVPEEADGPYSIGASGADDVFADPVIALYIPGDRGDGFVRLLGQDDDGGDGSDSMLDMQLDSGAYFVRVGTWEDTGGRIEVLVDAGSSGVSQE